MLVIPSVDIKDGKVVRILRGDPNNVLFSLENPVDVARAWRDRGAKLIHIVDLDGAIEGRNQKETIIRILNTGVNATVGGGIRDFATAKSYLEHGAWSIVVSTMPFENPGEFEKTLQEYADRVILALDFDEEFRLATRGWTTFKERIFELKVIEKNFRGYLFTSIFRDGTNLGVPREHFKKISEFDFGGGKIKIASGGINSTDDLVFLRELGFWGAVVGRAFYEKKIDVFEI